MLKYVFIAKYSVDAIKGMISPPQDRKDAIGKLLSAAGMSMIDCFFSPSSARVVLIAEGPAKARDALVMMIMASGSFDLDAEVIDIVDSDEFIDCMKHAGKLVSAYKAAGQ
jgi:uncharacterized protein with GYD domain